MATFKLIKGDLLGNDNDGYDWNDSIPCGEFEIEDFDTLIQAAFDKGGSKEAVMQLVAWGIFSDDISKAKNFDVEWNWNEGQNEKVLNQLYIDFDIPGLAPRSLQRYELVEQE